MLKTYILIYDDNSTVEITTDKKGLNNILVNDFSVVDYIEK